MVYTIIRKRNVFHSLANLPTDHTTIQKSLSKRKLAPSTSSMSLNSCTSGMNNQSMEGSIPARPAEKGTLNASLAATPSLYIHLFTIYNLCWTNFKIHKITTYCINMYLPTNLLILVEYSRESLLYGATIGIERSIIFKIGF